jgi:hypothetical protein
MHDRLAIYRPFCQLKSDRTCVIWCQMEIIIRFSCCLRTVLNLLEQRGEGFMHLRRYRDLIHACLENPCGEGATEVMAYYRQHMESQIAKTPALSVQLILLHGLRRRAE